MRNSSVELFRIIATFLVLIVHFNGWFVNMPDKFEGYSIMNVSQSFIEAFSCTCVNCFLVITGWYGMTFKWKHVWTIWSIVAWIYVGLYILNSVLTHEFSIFGFIARFIAIEYESYYIQCYLMLLFLSPVLNSFITKYGKKILPYTIAFWAIEILFDWLLKNKCLGFGHGYMLTHFVFLYILGQTAFLFKDEIRRIFTSIRCIIIYCSGCIIIGFSYFFISGELSFAYSNPVNVIMSFALFFLFERHTFYNKTINWIASSTLAVYVFHITPPVINALRAWDVYAQTTYSSILS